MLKCIIVDDEQNAVDVLKLMVQQSGLLQLVCATTKPQEALDFINQQSADIAFLDIHMPGFNGLDLARALKGKCEVVFITGHSQFVTEAYELEVADYLLKPIPLPRFINAVHRVIKRIAPVNQPLQHYPQQHGGLDGIEDDYFFVKTEQKGKMVKINLADIDYVEGMKNYLAIYHSGRKTLALLNMKDMEDRLPSKYFVRVQKSFIVALHKISMVEANKLMLHNIDNPIAIGDMYRQQFMEAMKGKLVK
jgi:two-component system, LytTR family, response regulator